MRKSNNLQLDSKKLFIMCAKKGYSRVDLSKLSGVGMNTMRGVRPLRPTTLHKIAQALECEPEDLLKED